MFRATHIPPLSYLLDDLLTRDQAAIAKHLGVSTATLKRWIQADDAPRAALLALFYESRWGYSLMETTAHNGEMYARQELRFARQQIKHLQAEVARLESIGDFGAANAPRLEAL
jgi:hypothetical protein